MSNLTIHLKSHVSTVYPTRVKTFTGGDQAFPLRQLHKAIQAQVALVAAQACAQPERSVHPVHLQRLQARVQATQCYA